MAHMTHMELGFTSDGLLVICFAHMRRGLPVTVDYDTQKALNDVAEQNNVQVKYRPMFASKHGYMIQDHKRMEATFRKLGAEPTGENSWLVRCSDTHLAPEEFRKVLAKYHAMNKLGGARQGKVRSVAGS